jgi:hypothetical protein
MVFEGDAHQQKLKEEAILSIYSRLDIRHWCLMTWVQTLTLVLLVLLFVAIILAICCQAYLWAWLLFMVVSELTWLKNDVVDRGG